MKKKISIISITLLALVVAIGCSAQDKPEDTVAEYIEGMKAFDIELMASKVNPEERGDLEDFSDLKDDEESLEKFFLDYIEENAKKITYSINDSTIDADKALVNVDFKYVDGGPLFKATFGEYMANMFELAFTDTEKEITEEEYSAAFMTAMENQSQVIEETFTEKNLDINCIKIDDKWYIDEISDELLDVAMTNMISVGGELNQSFETE